MMTPFYGRKKELERLSWFLRKGTSSLITLTGRRGIGKTRFVQEFAKDYTFYHFTGLVPTSATTKQSQLDEFAQQLSEQTDMPQVKVDDWSSLFHLLAQKLETGRIILLFDEVNWLASKAPLFTGKLKNAWDIYFKKNPELIFILSSSAPVWMDKYIHKSKGFFGRVSLYLTLDELPLTECNKFLPPNLSAYEKVQLLSVTGGVPGYLEKITPSDSVDNTIQNLCFSKDGLLVNEYDKSFAEIFSRKAPTYKKVAETLISGPLEIKDITKALGITQTGAISSYLDDLILSGFIKRDYTWHIKTAERSRLSHFRLSDNYLLFYLKYLQKSPSFTSVESLPQWYSFKDLTFNNLALANYRYLLEQLNISLEDLSHCDPYFQRPTKRIPGCTIDFLIQTTFNTLYACEFKLSPEPIEEDIIPNVQKKIASMVIPKGFSLCPVLVHVNGVHEEVEYSRFFSKIIDLSKLLEHTTD